MVRGTRTLDFAGRLDAGLSALRTRLESRDAVINAVRDANASLDPQKVAVWLVMQAEEWMPAPCWAVVAPDVTGQLGVLAATGGSPTINVSVLAVAGWVMSHDSEFMTADLSTDRRIPEAGVEGTARAFPLLCRARTTAVLVGLDPLPSTAAPSLGDAVATAWRGVLEPAAIALENALNLRKAEALSITDDLTGLSNSRYLNLVLRREEKRTGPPGALSVAERVCERMRVFHFLTSNELDVHLTASVGVATLPDVTGSAEELLKAADRAMYRVKDAGKNGIYVAEEEEDEPKVKE